MDIMRVEAFLRVCATLLFITTACLVRLDTQTSLIFTSFSRTATFRDMNALFVLVFIDIAAAGYNLIQLVIRGLLSSHLKPDMTTSYKHLAWLSFLFDQVVAYMVFAATSAALTASLLALTGEHDLFWMKLCNKFNRFCTQIGGAMLCGYTAFIFMVMVSSLSAFGLFRHYSPRSFLDLK
ncbi:CASP-like protein 2C1 [Cynara cardunculus var. scolymus]|uniref:CASP-like protein 2C1 n=1 Tax=Cynara cardunculus var. scolymus TaxID=59895 RepID=UPI000D6310DD|nr:CASP-like protein 2C1 [Cynara cardunculus var. scolymus]